MRARPVAFLLAANVAAVLGATWFVRAALSEPEAPSREPAEPAVAVAPMPSGDTVSIDALTSAPLFTPSRKPPVALAPPVPPAAPPEPPRLVGILAGASGHRQVLLEAPSGDVRHLLPIGGEFNGWTITAIRRNSITLKQQAPAGAQAQDGLTLTLHPHGASTGSTGAHND